ncbi:ABC transporter ATP-binding protein [Actinomyces glycerinitolerans]|uniref:Abc transporter n=1 Tax=Actinomyces glycerinitolerans TaxID=1892869 RepID=A0A1M4S2B5_9ACTO|nr:ATP-binding cassette domain-containing protein [Actinomyces glycerinitolerans]SHE26386.1 abc transporter [Actinomyces glycerinitolerans]
MLDIANLSKRFGSLQALDALSLRLGDGEIVGFVGANGAGKSTTMRIVMGVLTADAGSVTWDGAPVGAAERRRIGYMPEERGLYPKMKVGEQLTYLARLHGVTADAARRAGEQWTERLDIAARRDDEVQKLSLGNQQRVQLAAALVSDPDLLILDEPFSGLDPVAVDVMSQVLRERAAAGVPTLFSSHQLDVVQRLCDRVVIIREGRLVADGTVAELQAGAEPRWRAVVEVAGEPDAAVGAATAMLAGTPGVEASAEPIAEGARVTVVAGGPDEQRLLEAAQRLGRLRELGPVTRPLTEIFRDVLAAPTASPAPTTGQEA